MAARRSADFRALAASIDGLLVLPDDSHYVEALGLFQPRFDVVRPAAIACPAHPQDVATCLTFARGQQAPVVPRGGGHSYAGWSTGNGLVVDLSAVSQVSSGAGTALIGAGARLADLDAALAADGVAVPAGLCPSVSFAGLALGGGLGVTSRVYGTTSDNVTAARIVTVDGLVRDVDADHEPDLFWALRGAGGGNFGVVTHLRLATHPAPDCAHAEFHWNWGDAAALIPAWQRWVARLPDHVWCGLEFDTGSDALAPYLGAICLDGPDELNRQLGELVALVGVEPADTYMAVRSYGDTMRKLAGCLDVSAAQCHVPGALPGHDPGGVITRENYAARSDFWPSEMPAEAVAATLAALARYRDAVPAGGHGVVQFHAVGGQVNRVAAAATAYSHRDATFTIPPITPAD